MGEGKQTLNSTGAEHSACNYQDRVLLIPSRGKDATPFFASRCMGEEGWQNEQHHRGGWEFGLERKKRQHSKKV